MGCGHEVNGISPCFFQVKSLLQNELQRLYPLGIKDFIADCKRTKCAITTTGTAVYPYLTMYFHLTRTCLFAHLAGFILEEEGLFRTNVKL
jgi:hypothetical protein